jgi:hypothetical protein
VEGFNRLGPSEPRSSAPAAHSSIYAPLSPSTGTSRASSGGGATRADGPAEYGSASHYSCWGGDWRESVCHVRRPHCGQRVRICCVRFVDFQRIPPRSHKDRSCPHSGQRSSQARDSASIASAHEPGTSEVIRRWNQFISVASLVLPLHQPRVAPLRDPQQLALGGLLDFGSIVRYPPSTCHAARACSRLPPNSVTRRRWGSMLDAAERGSVRQRPWQGCRGR